MTDPANATMKDAIRRALDNPHKTHEDRIEAVHAAVLAQLATDIPAIIQHAMETPATLAAMTKDLVIPIMRDLEDEINELHDNPKTPDGMRLGLRLAARTIRGVRLEVQKDIGQ